jgi:hypothetical protein
MRVRSVLLAILLCASPSIFAQAPAPQPAAEPAAPLPVRRVVLYKTGVGYFEHLGNVRDREDVTIRFTSAQLNDVLKSLTTLDLGKGRITGISYNSIAPLEQRLGALRLPLDSSATTRDLLASLRGARVEVTAGAATAAGRLLSVERRERPDGNRIVSVETFSIVTDTGELRSFELEPGVRVRIAERNLRQEVSRYLDVVGSGREQDVRRMVISTAGTGDRALFVSYVSEVPIWKSTYRLVLRSQAKPLLQGWAIVDNTIGEDWRNVELSLVAGAPQSFVQQISQPFYGRRPVVPLAATAMTTPQTHQATMKEFGGLGVGSGGGVGPGPGTGSGVGGGMYRPGRPGVPAGAVGGVVGGLPGAPPPPPPPAAERVYEQMAVADISQDVTAAALGDLFEYRIKEPVTVAKNQSALVPIVSAEVEIEKVALWSQPSGSGRPLRAVWLTNTSRDTLDGGSITLIDGDAFAGEGLIEPIKPGERRLVSYGRDLGVQVRAGGRSGPTRIARVRARDGIIIHDTEERSTTTYLARNANAAAVTLVVEHRIRPGWKLTGDLRPAETSAGAYRFRIVIEPGNEATLDVQEARSAETSIAIGEITDAFAAGTIKSYSLTPEMEAALAPLFAKRTEIAVMDRRIGELQAQQQTIIKDQDRLRENMKALGGSSEEKRLLQRYTRQLDQQEDALEQLRRDLTDVTATRGRAQEELSRLISTLTF